MQTEPSEIRGGQPEARRKGRDAGPVVVTIGPAPAIDGLHREDPAVTGVLRTVLIGAVLYAYCQFVLRMSS